MAIENKAGKKINSPGDSLLKTTTELLNTLTSLKEKLGEKEFKKRIKKAANKLVAGIKKTPLKKAAKPALKK